MDAKIFGLIAVATLALVGAIKKAFPAWTDKKEEFLAVLLPVVLTAAAKLLGAFHDTSWVDALLWAFGAGVSSGVLHDYVLNPVIGSKGSAPKG